MVFPGSLITTVLLSVLVAAAPFEAVEVDTVGELVVRQGPVSALSAPSIATYRPYALYAAAAYCMPRNTLTWTCGVHCEGNSGFKPVASGGNGITNQFWFVGYDPALNTIIVSRQGTDATKIVPILTDLNLRLRDLDSDMFPGAPSGLKVHDGFGISQTFAAKDILAAVKTAFLTFPQTTKVTITGHSLGGALATIDAVYLKLNLPSTMQISLISYASPRVGNSKFADYVDSLGFDESVRFTNGRDPVSIIPGRLIGFRHVSGEVHIADSGGAWNACSGQENTSPGCTLREIPTILTSDVRDHKGPFDGVRMSCDRKS